MIFFSGNLTHLVFEAFEFFLHVFKCRFQFGDFFGCCHAHGLLELLSGAIESPFDGADGYVEYV